MEELEIIGEFLRRLGSNLKILELEFSNSMTSHQGEISLNKGTISLNSSATDILKRHLDFSHNISLHTIILNDESCFSPSNPVFSGQLGALLSMMQAPPLEEVQIHITNCLIPGSTSSKVLEEASAVLSTPQFNALRCVRLKILASVDKNTIKESLEWISNAFALHRDRGILEIG